MGLYGSYNKGYIQVVPLQWVVIYLSANTTTALLYFIIILIQSLHTYPSALSL